MLEKLKEDVCKANLQLPEYGLVTFTWGNVSGIDREKGLFVIKPSGVSYEELKPSDMVVIDMDGNKVEGDLNPSTDTLTHLELYKAFPEIGGVVHTHSTFATSWAQAGHDIPLKGNPVYVPGVICRNHGPFAWGKDCFQAVYHAKVLEEVAKMDFITKMIDPSAPDAPEYVKEKHFLRKHGPNAYYGQGKG